MKEFIEKLIGRLEECEKAPKVENSYNNGWKTACQVMKNVVNQLAEEYKDGWIPCSVDLPKIPNSYLVTKMCENDGNPIYETAHEIFWTSDKKWDCERDEYCDWKVIAWQNKIAPYQPKGE